MGDGGVGGGDEEERTAGGFLFVEVEEELFVVGEGGGIQFRQCGDAVFESCAAGKESGETPGEAWRKREGKNSFEESVGADEGAIEIDTQRWQFRRRQTSDWRTRHGRLTKLQRYGYMTQRRGVGGMGTELLWMFKE